MKGHIRKRGEHSWRIMIYLGKNEEGKKEYYCETFRGLKRDAEKRAAELINEIHKQTFAKPSKMTLAEFLHRWLEDYAKQSVRPMTYDMYEMLVRVHITPAIGHVALDKLTPLDIQRFLAQTSNSPRRDGKPGRLAPYTVKHIHDILRAALRHAVKWQLLARNPAEAVDPPKVDRKPFKVWTAEEAATFLAAAKSDRHYAAYLLAIGAGLRRGEILGLRWEDIDFVERSVKVSQAAIPTAQGIVLQQPKTAGSRRVVAISEETAEALKERFIEAQKERKAYESLYGPGSYSDLGLVFAGYDGKPLDTRSFTRRFERLVRKAGVPRIRFHDLRHTHATLMLQAGVHVKVISERLGHNNISTTMNTYAHVLPTLQQEAAAVVDGLLGLSRNSGLPRDCQNPIQ